MVEASPELKAELTQFITDYKLVKAAMEFPDVGADRLQRQLERGVVSSGRSQTSSAPCAVPRGFRGEEIEMSPSVPSISGGGRRASRARGFSPRPGLR